MSENVKSDKYIKQIKYRGRYKEFERTEKVKR